jgi:hypothetical protein
MNLDKLLGALAQSGLGRATGGGGAAGGINIGGILSQVLGGGAGAPAAGGGGLGGGLGGLLQSLGGGAAASGGGGLGGLGGGLGGILNSLGGGGQNQSSGGLGGGLGGGLMTIIAGLAMQALQNRGGGGGGLLSSLGDAPPVVAPPSSASDETAPGAGSGGGFLNMADSVGGAPAAHLIGQDTAHRIIRTMIAAAAADGTIDDSEAEAIQGHLGQEDAAEREFLENEMRNPATPEQLAAGVSGPQEAAQIYTAALLTVTMDTPEESGFLKKLALALKLDPQTIASLHQTVKQGQ